MAAPRTPQRIGQYAGPDNWDGYWETAVSDVSSHVLKIRGYPIDDLVSRLSYTETLYLTIRGELPTPSEARVLDAALSALPDHGFLSTHAGAARFVSSGWPSSIVPGIVAGLLCIGEITISPQDTGELITEGMSRMEAQGRTAADVAAEIVEEHLSSKRLLPGIGHPQHKDEDIRAAALRKVVEQEDMWRPGIAFFHEVHRVFVERKGGFLPVNIDGMLGAVLFDLGFAPLQMSGLAAVAILPGLIAHTVEEVLEGVPLRIIPDGKYSGVDTRRMTDDQGRHRNNGAGAARTE